MQVFEFPAHASDASEKHISQEQNQKTCGQNNKKRDHGIITIKRPSDQSFWFAKAPCVHANDVVAEPCLRPRNAPRKKGRMVVLKKESAQNFKMLVGCRCPWIRRAPCDSLVARRAGARPSPITRPGCEAEIRVSKGKHVLVKYSAMKVRDRY